VISTICVQDVSPASVTYERGHSNPMPAAFLVQRAAMQHNARRQLQIEKAFFFERASFRGPRIGRGNLLRAYLGLRPSVEMLLFV
jgi:hypothetical protein